MIPLPDMRWPRFNGEEVRAVLSVAGQPGDPRHSLGIPKNMPTHQAVSAARRRGWHVLGVWKPCVRPSAD